MYESKLNYIQIIFATKREDSQIDVNDAADSVKPGKKRRGKVPAGQ